MALFVITAFKHGLDGLKVAVDDYVHDDGTRIGIHFILTMAAIAGSAVGIPAGSAGAALIKAKDEVTLAYKLEPLAQGKQALSNTDKAKASRDGEDVIKPLVEKASETIKTTIAQK